MIAALVLALCIAALGAVLGLVVGPAICCIVARVLYKLGLLIYDKSKRQKEQKLEYKFINNFLDRIIEYKKEIISILAALFIYGFIYASTYFLLFLTNHTRNLKSIAVFSLFISCLCYVHLFLKSVYDFFNAAKNPAAVAAVSVLEAKGPNEGNSSGTQGNANE